MCAICGVSLPDSVVSELGQTATYLVFHGLKAQQSRGQDGSGMYAVGETGSVYHRGLGLVPDVYHDNDVLKFRAHLAIGHDRYSTKGPPSAVNLQPHVVDCCDGQIALASNGDIPNYHAYRQRVESPDRPFRSDNDGELLAHLVAQAYDQLGSMPQAIQKVMNTIDGAYSVVMTFRDSLFVFRDPRGIRPLVTCRLPQGGHVFASETIAFDKIRGDRSTYDQVLAGAIIEVCRGELTVHQPGRPASAACIFELMYFSRPDTQGVSLYRRRVGWRLAHRIKHLELHHPVISAVPDSSNAIAKGVADVLQVPLVDALIRAHGARRTFIEREQRIRDEGVNDKFNPDSWLVDGRDVILVDDSIVRGTTMHQLIRMLRGCGARRIILLIGSPPVRYPCYMGIATPTKAELIASKLVTEQVAQRLEVDLLVHISLPDALGAAGVLTPWERRDHAAYLGPNVDAIALRLRNNQTGYCAACFSGQYPLPIPSHLLTE